MCTNRGYHTYAALAPIVAARVSHAAGMSAVHIVMVPTSTAHYPPSTCSSSCATPLPCHCTYRISDLASVWVCLNIIALYSYVYYLYYIYYLYYVYYLYYLYMYVHYLYYLYYIYYLYYLYYVYYLYYLYYVYYVHNGHIKMPYICTYPENNQGRV